MTYGLESRLLRGAGTLQRTVSRARNGQRYSDNDICGRINVTTQAGDTSAYDVIRARLIGDQHAQKNDHHPG